MPARVLGGRRREVNQSAICARRHLYYESLFPKVDGRADRLDRDTARVIVGSGAHVGRGVRGEQPPRRAGRRFAESPAGASLSPRASRSPAGTLLGAQTSLARALTWVLTRILNTSLLSSFRIEWRRQLPRPMTPTRLPRTAARTSPSESKRSHPQWQPDASTGDPRRARTTSYLESLCVTLCAWMTLHSTQRSPD